MKEKYFDTKYGPIQYVSRTEDRYKVHFRDFMKAQLAYRKEQERLKRVPFTNFNNL